VDDPKEYIEGIQKVPLGVGFIDMLTGGGPAFGQTTGFIMPSKGGKTSLCCQIAGAAVSRRKHVMYFQFEQQMEGDISQRIYSVATGTPVENWAKADSIPTGALDRWKKVRSSWLHYFTIVDYWIDPDHPLTSLADIFNAVDERNKLRPEGETVEIIMLDWWRAMELKMGLGMSSESENRHRDDRSRLTKEFTGYVQSRNMRAFVFQQLTGAKADQKKPASMYDGIEDKAWGFFWDYVFTSNRPTEDNHNTVKFKLDGARHAGSSSVSQCLDPEYRIFRDVQNEGISNHMVEQIRKDLKNGEEDKKPVSEQAVQKNSQDSSDIRDVYSNL
jgi:RecA/RadA recombinase